jgi:hypothetical protein
MTDFLGSVKADLLDRRILPILVLLGVALVGALAYALLGGGGSASTPAPVVSPVSPLSTAVSASSISVTQAPTGTGQPVAETTSGSAHRSAGASRNPFAPLPGAQATGTPVSEATPGSSESSSTSSPSTTSGTGSEAGSESPGGGGSSTPQAKQPSKAKKQTVYTVAALFGAVPAGSPSPSPTLTPYEHLKRQQPLPSSTQPLVVFRGVTAGGKSASFTLVGEAILRGGATCLPNPAQCEVIDLKQGQVEELEYVPLEGAPVVYQLQVVSIDASKASASAARRIFHTQSQEGLQFLRASGLSALPGLRYSAEKGVLVFAGHRAFAARAHVAAWGASLRG